MDNLIAPALSSDTNEAAAKKQNPEGIAPSQTGGINASVQNVDEEEWNVGKTIVLVVLGIFILVSTTMSLRDFFLPVEEGGSKGGLTVLFWPGLSLVLFCAVLFFHHHKRNWRKGTGKTLGSPDAAERE